MLRTPKRLIALTIILFWLLMMGTLLYREVVMPRMYRGLRSQRIVTPQTLWLGVYFGESQRVGFVHLRTTPEERDSEKGYAMQVMVRLELPLFGQSTRFHFSGGAWQSAQAGLRNFDFTFASGDHEMRIEGDARDGVIEAVLTTAGESIPFRFPVGREVLLAGGMGLGASSMPKLTPGQIAYVDTFDPTTMSVGRAKIEALRRETIEIAGEPVETVLTATTVAGITSRAWINENEEVVRAELPFGLIIKQISPEEALAPLASDESVNIIRALAIPVTGPAPDPDASALRLRISGVSEELMPPSDERQQRQTNGIYLIGRQDPRDAVEETPLAPEEAAAYLAADLFIQSNHPRIIETAQMIVGDTEDAWGKAVGIHDWLYENIAKEHVLSVPSALDALEARTGDCNEHAVLFCALARAVGVPSRVVIGLAWSRQMQAFGYHAWVEVYGDRWIAMDPTFGERTVSPTHIKLFSGGIDQWPRLLPYIGALEIETLDLVLNGRASTLQLELKWHQRITAA